jgi:hypothetical protein
VITTADFDEENDSRLAERHTSSLKDEEKAKTTHMGPHCDTSRVLKKGAAA